MDQFQASEDLRKKILFQIVKEERRKAKMYLLVSLVTATTSVIGVVFSVGYTVQTISQSSFYRYLSLLFSDPDIVLSYWEVFMMSLLESLPFFAVTLVLVAVVVLMLSIRIFINNSQRDLTLSFSN